MNDNLEPVPHAIDDDFKMPLRRRRLLQDWNDSRRENAKSWIC